MYPVQIILLQKMQIGLKRIAILPEEHQEPAN
jgi:hypothetical protein